MHVQSGLVQLDHLEVRKCYESNTPTLLRCSATGSTHEVACHLRDVRVIHEACKVWHAAAGSTSSARTSARTSTRTSTSTGSSTRTAAAELLCHFGYSGVAHEVVHHIRVAHQVLRHLPHHGV